MRWVSWALVLVWVTGCATAPKIDWNSRIGNYSYDQAVLEFGPPDRMATLTDGTKVVEWLSFRGRSHGYATSLGPSFYHPYFYGPPVHFFSEPPSPDRFLRLTFSPDGRLVDWRKVYR